MEGGYYVVILAIMWAVVVYGLMATSVYGLLLFVFSLGLQLCMVSS